MAWSILSLSEWMVRPLPRCRWPASELPTVPSGMPTALPEASRVVKGCSRRSRSITGVWAWAMRLPSVSSLYPQPSTIKSRTLRLSCPPDQPSPSKLLPVISGGLERPSSWRMVGATSFRPPPCLNGGRSGDAKMKSTGLSVWPVSMAPSGYSHLSTVP